MQPCWPGRGRWRVGASGRPACRRCGCSPISVAWPIRVRWWRACRRAWPAWRCATTRPDARRAGPRSGAALPGAAAEAGGGGRPSPGGGAGRRRASARGRWPAGAPVPARRRGALLTSSAHGAAELRRAARAGVDLAFLSPAFATRSHKGAAALGPPRWGRLARGAALPVAALGGIDGGSVRRLPRGLCRGVGAIDALADAMPAS